MDKNAKSGGLVKAENGKPELSLLSVQDITVDKICAFYKSITGKESTAEDRADIEKILANQKKRN